MQLSFNVFHVTAFANVTLNRAEGVYIEVSLTKLFSFVSIFGMRIMFGVIKRD